MKLKNSFLIVAGVFFFAVAFINFAKAGDDGGDGGSMEIVVKNSYDEIKPCMSVLYMKLPYYRIEDDDVNLDGVDGWTRQTSAEGNKTVCFEKENSTCMPTPCSGAEKLIFW